MQLADTGTTDTMLGRTRHRDDIDQARLAVEHGFGIAFEQVQRSRNFAGCRRFARNLNLVVIAKAVELLFYGVGHFVDRAAAHLRVLVAETGRQIEKLAGVLAHVHHLDMGIEAFGDHQRGVEHIGAALAAVYGYQDYFDHLSTSL